MNIKTAVAAAMTAVGLALGGPLAAQSLAGPLAPHEKTTVAPNGMSVTVGHYNNAARAVTPLNFMPTSREVYLDNTSYGRIDGDGTGTIESGYFFACAVDMDVSFTISANAGIDLGSTIGVSAGATMVTPTASVDISPSIGASIGMTLGLAPGEIAQVTRGTKDIPAGGTAYITENDYRLTVNNCAGPLTVQAYTIIEATSPEADAAEWVMGDPFVL
ncbi:MspA family porin [Nocardia huaxiensis]|uniref:MspA family porin n=1 Tax=Nocardia huaxiensis TaxID=2755382 RepID=A0A7D6VL14_9NOCA|nr:MspA family porin [Nocardia huaxiensis]QLY31950.1 MspA family porin [Nocardia huaxiensis]